MTWSSSIKKFNRLQANVSTLKVHLGRYLKIVKEGEDVVVLDRQHPVAKLIAFTGDDARLVETLPTSSWQDVVKRLRVADRKREPTALKHKAMTYLKLDRENR